MPLQPLRESPRPRWMSTRELAAMLLRPCRWKKRRIMEIRLVKELKRRLWALPLRGVSLLGLEALPLTRRPELEALPLLRSPRL